MFSRDEAARLMSDPKFAEYWRQKQAENDAMAAWLPRTGEDSRLFGVDRTQHARRLDDEPIAWWRLRLWSLGERIQRIGRRVADWGGP